MFSCVIIYVSVLRSQLTDHEKEVTGLEVKLEKVRERERERERERDGDGGGGLAHNTCQSSRGSGNEYCRALRISQKHCWNVVHKAWGDALCI